MTIQNIEDRLNEEKLNTIKGLISEQRLENFQRVLTLRTKKVVLCLENIYHPHNASATLRTAEAFGVQEVNVIETLCKFSPSTDIVRGTDKWLEINHWNSTGELTESLRKRGYRIVVTSPHAESCSLEKYKITSQPIALFMGTEKTGISEELEKGADDIISIPMFGLAESLNISVSTAIILQRLTEQVRALPKEEWTLEKNEQQNLLINWIASSLRNGHRVIENILESKI